MDRGSAGKKWELEDFTSKLYVHDGFIQFFESCNPIYVHLNDLDFNHNIDHKCNPAKLQTLKVAENQFQISLTLVSLFFYLIIAI